MRVKYIFSLFREALVEAIEKNYTMISLDLSENPKMGLKEVRKV